jgi:uncharacterized RDD family membrane protein YckC
VNQPIGPDRSAVRKMPKQAYTPWISRVLAYVIDAVPGVAVVAVGFGIELATRETLCAAETTEYDIGPICVTGNTWLGVFAFLASIGIALVYLLWNFGYRQGKAGSSIGKSVMKFKVVDERTGRPIGFGRSVVRQVVHLVDALICYLGYLFPLWEPKRQTIADKVMKTVCFPL